MNSSFFEPIFLIVFINHNYAPSFFTRLCPAGDDVTNVRLMLRLFGFYWVWSLDFFSFYKAHKLLSTNSGLLLPFV